MPTNPTIISEIIVNGEPCQLDYTALANLPNITSILSRLASLEQRVSDLDGGSAEVSEMNASVTGDKLTLNDANASVTSEILHLPSSAADVENEKLIFA